MRPDLPLDRALEWISGRGQALVLDDGQVVGRLTTRDLDRWYRRQVLGEAVPDEAGPIRPDPTSGVSATGGSIRSVSPPFMPDPDQQAVLEHRSGPLLVTGTAGTGKSWVLRERFAQLVESGADPERIALVVESRRARQAARDALIARVPSSLSSLNVLTFHGLAHLILRERFAALGYAEPPEVLSAADQFALVQDLLQGQDLTEWPAYGHLLTLRGFADQIRQFLLRAQEALLTPQDIEGKADARGLSGWHELARFYRDYLDVLDADRVVDFAALIGRARAAVAGSDAPLLDHLLVDDYQDATLAQEALIEALRVGDIVAAADPEAHVFSFQGTTVVPSLRFTERFNGASRVELRTSHRAEHAIAIDAWSAAHTSEEYAAVARELRRLHVEEGVPWGDLAVVVRRQGAHVGGLLRALDDARAQRPERCLALAGAVDPAVRARAAVARGLGGRARRPRGIRADLRPRPAVPGRGPRPDARVAHADGVRRERPRVLGRADR